MYTYIFNAVIGYCQMVYQILKEVDVAHHSSPCDSPVKFVLFNVYRDKLHMVQVVGEEYK